MKILHTWHQTLSKSPAIVLSVIFLLLISASWTVSDFRLDASSDALVLQSDPALQEYRKSRVTFGSDDYVVIAYRPQQDLFSDESITDVRELSESLRQLKRVDSVFSYIDAPLIEASSVTLQNIDDDIATLQSAEVDKSQAKAELIYSDLYRNLLISEDGKTAAIQVQFKPDAQYRQLLEERNRLQQRQHQSDVTDAEKERYQQVAPAFDAHNAFLQQQITEDIANIREVIATHSTKAKITLAGMPMIIADSIRFIQNDLLTFGLAVSGFMLVILVIAFRATRWLVFPLLTCFATTYLMLGLLGFLHWPITVVSANFISLLLIITLSLTIHLIVRYRECENIMPQASQKELIIETLNSKFIPCFYTALTTMVAFASLIFSDIKPVSDFGWMMVFGIIIALVLTLTLFPCMLMLLKRESKVKGGDVTKKITASIATLVHQYPRMIGIIFLLLALFASINLRLLSVENRFIDYFRPNTEIYQGMTFIDQQLGGTTPLDVILEAPKQESIQNAQERISDFLEDEEFADDFPQDPQQQGMSSKSHWYNRHQLPTVQAIHEYLDELPETGKVLSLATTMRVLDKLDQEKILDDFQLSILYQRLSTQLKETLFTPYLSDDGQELRFSIRVFESDPNLKRDQLIQKIEYDLQHKFELGESQIKLTGMMVLYNNVLKSLFASQILTLGIVFIAIFLMFCVLFRNVKLALITLAPNVFSALLILGIMGFFHIPLDIMTITIAAISVGIGVDDAIHYIHRLSDEISKDGNYWAAIKRSHASIGMAMYYTTVTIALGFSLLVLSNFMPTVYFGLLTAVAMITALSANLTLLPLLVVWFEGFGRAENLMIGNS